MQWQNRISVLVLPLFFFPTLLHASQKISSPLSDHIIDSALFNYDNLIADHYEEKTSYSAQLAYLLHQGTGYPPETFLAILNNETLNQEANPVFYMQHINRETKKETGYYFIDE